MTTGVAPGLSRLGPLRNRNFRYFWIGNFLSNIGTWMQSVAQGWLVLELASKAPPEIFDLAQARAQARAEAGVVRELAFQ